MRFGDFYAVRDINLDINNGEYVTILGPSGCGKTTLIKVISGIWTPTEGKVFVDGMDVTNVPLEDRDVGYVFQNIALFPHMTLKENVAYSPRVKDQGEEAMESLSTEYLGLVNMLSRAGMLPKEISGGEQQKVAIARALASGSKMLMLDEPLSALDARVRVELRYELRRLVKKLGITVLPASAIPYLSGFSKSLKIIPFKAPVPTRRVLLVWRKSYPRMQAVEAVQAAVNKLRLNGCLPLDEKPRMR